MSKKTLYISDLDGTLLDKNAELSDFTKRVLCELSAKGIHLSAATARTSATVSKMLAGTGFDTPVVLMNGVCMYDIEAGRYVFAHMIDMQAKSRLIQSIHKYSLGGFLYAVDDGILSTYYEKADDRVARSFIEERQIKYGKVFTKVNSFEEILDRNIIYYSIPEKETVLRPAADEIRTLEGLRAEYYRDIYDEKYFFLEVCSPLASKHTAVDKIRKNYGFDEIVGFGDNYNDIPLADACDRFYAVENAVDELKSRATGIIGANTADGVAHFLIENT